MKAHSTLVAFRKKWIGKAVCGSIVDGVGDDGSQCDFDARRGARPNGLLFLKDGSQIYAGDIKRRTMKG